LPIAFAVFAVSIAARNVAVACAGLAGPAFNSLASAESRGGLGGRRRACVSAARCPDSSSRTSASSCSSTSDGPRRSYAASASSIASPLVARFTRAFSSAAARARASA
jgi:hypothetical protein